LIDRVKVLCPTCHKIGQICSSRPISWLGMDKLNLTQQTHTLTNQKKCTIQNKQKTEARFSRLLWHLAWQRRGPILVLALHKFVTYLLRHLPIYLQLHMGR